MAMQVLYSAIFYGIIGAGGVYMGTNPRSQPHELEHLLQLAEPKFIITSPDGLPMLREVISSSKELSSSRINLCLLDQYAITRLSQILLSDPSTGQNTTDLPEEETPTDVLNFSSLLEHGESDWIRFNDKTVAESTPAAMFTTSGTGGLPKAAILSHHSIVTHHLSIQYPVPYDVTRLMSLPMFHLFGALWSHIFPIRYGQPLYVLPRFEIDQYVRTIYLYRITETYMVPAMVQALNRCSSLVLAEYLASLRYIGVAGAAIDAPSLRRFQEKLHPDAQISQLWGMTETGVAFQIRYGERDNSASIGRLLPNYEIKLVDNNGQAVTGDNRPGELYIRGPGTLIGYKGMPPAKQKDGWFRTGDIVCVRHGKFYIVGRAKELIKVRG
jgi:acyl-CoA synthetase (AMP-forming)/AMP-acid ligase II